MAKGLKPSEIPFEEHRFTLTATQFYGSIVTACLVVIGAAYAMHSSLDQRVGALDQSFRDVIAENSRLQGRLEGLLPLLESQLLERASVDPASLGILPIMDGQFDRLDSGLNVIETSYLSVLRDAGLIDIPTWSSEDVTEFSVVDCKFDVNSKSCALFQPEFDLSDTIETWKYSFGTDIFATPNN